MPDVNLTNYRSYQGNPNLKRSGVGVEWTEELMTEYIRCSEDPVYFAENYMKIINVDHGLVPFILYDYQKEMIYSMHNNRYTIIATARQSGKSTVSVAYILWYILFNADKVVALLANKGDTAREILGKITLAYQHLPKWLQQGVMEMNKGSIALENQSRVIATATSGDSIRGYAINLLFIDEAAFIENWDEFFTSTFPTISSGETTKTILVSTPNGMNHFHQIWTLADQKKNEYYPIKVTWHQVPNRDAAWKERTLAGMSYNNEKFAQEYEVEFLGSSGSLIAGWKLKELTVSWKVPIAQHDSVYQYEKPRPDVPYAIVCDVSGGKGRDYSAFQVIDCSEMPYRQVCVFKSNVIPPIEYAEVINRVARSYNNAMVLVETNSMGGQVVDTLHYDYEYENILYTEHAGRDGKKISHGFGGTKQERGVVMTQKVKLAGCSLLKLLIEQDKLIINDHNTVSELTTFVANKASYAAESGKYDDLVTPLVLFAWMSDQEYFKNITDINTFAMLRENSQEQVEEGLMPFGFTNGNDENPFGNELGAAILDDAWFSELGMNDF